MCRLSCNLWAWTSWNPLGLSGPVMGLLLLGSVPHCSVVFVQNLVEYLRVRLSQQGNPQTRQSARPLQEGLQWSNGVRAAVWGEQFGSWPGLDWARHWHRRVNSEETNRSWFRRCGYSSLHRSESKFPCTAVHCGISELSRWKLYPYTFTPGRFKRPSSQLYLRWVTAVCSGLVILCRLTRLPRSLQSHLVDVTIPSTTLCWLSCAMQRT